MAFIPFAPRAIRFLGLSEAGKWRLKTYSIVHGGRALEERAFRAGLVLALRELPEPARNGGRPGLGFVVFHQGQTGDYVVLCWWDRENELPVRVFVRDQGAWRPAMDSESICVWDLEILWHERCAYVETLLGSAVTSPEDAYLARVLVSPSAAR